jgi:hypothetical protein
MPGTGYWRWLAVLLLAATAVAAPPKSELWPRWTAHDPASTLTVDHAAWGGFLRKYVREHTDGVNRVAYAGVTPEDRRALADYLQGLTRLPVSSLSRAEQRAYWINLYNALTVSLILEHYPVARILDIRTSPGFFAIGPWGAKLTRVEGEALTLDDIEHRILRPIWQDPRIHYAVNCASIGCPNLQREAFTAANAESLLDRAAREYVNHPRGASVRDGRVVVSSIYAWFREDFGTTDAGVLAHLKRYAEPGLARSLEVAGRIHGDDYDWLLNDETPCITC